MPIRVLVVDDSVLFRTLLQINLNEDASIKVIGGAANAIEAMQMVNELSPDVLILDVEMPQINGIDFLKQLFKTKRIPTVVISSMPHYSLEALKAGAVDFVRKPSVASPSGQRHFIDELKSKVKIAAIAKVQCPPRHSAQLYITPPVVRSNNNTVIAIGASTGGTEAILQVVKDLPATTPGIIIVQHMPANFTNLYAERLNKLCKMTASEAVDRERVTCGKIILAAGDAHLTLARDAQGYYIRSAPGEKVSGHCPSVDVLFDSVAQVAGKDAIGVLLTGMGADGARGITKMKHGGAYTIGQDKDSCVVYGMPMEAFKMGGIARQLPLDQISGAILNQCRQVLK